MKRGSCDGCHRNARLTSVGRDSNGDLDAPDLCFLCQREGARGKIYHSQTKRYIRPSDLTEEETNDSVEGKYFGAGSRGSTAALGEVPCLRKPIDGGVKPIRIR